MAARLRHSDYLKFSLNPKHIPHIVKMCCKALKKYDFDTIAFSGMSGALIAPIVAYKLKKHILMVRKSKEDSHASFTVEGNWGSEKYIILDDLISSGATVKRIVNGIKSSAPKAVCLGSCLYYSQFAICGEELHKEKDFDFDAYELDTDYRNGNTRTEAASA